MNARPVVFALHGHRRFVTEGADLGALTVRRFANRELIAQLTTPVDGRDCVVIGSVAPPEAELARLTLAAHTLRREGAGRVTALMPYLAYARQDVAGHAESLGLTWIGDLLRASGVDDVVTVDVHSPRAAELLGLPVLSVSPARLLAAALPRDSVDQATFVAPDEGAVERCAALASAAGGPDAVAHLVKRRSREGVAHMAVRGDVGPRAVVVDDILDTGATVASCCGMLRERGVRRIALVATHGLFTGDAASVLAAAGVEALWVTDSILAARRPRETFVVALASLLAPHVLGVGTSPHAVPYFKRSPESAAQTYLRVDPSLPDPSPL